jgi:hypothetical protein
MAIKEFTVSAGSHISCEHFPSVVPTPGVRHAAFRLVGLLLR